MRQIKSPPLDNARFCSYPKRMSYRIRVIEMIIVPARELLDHAGNWAIHPAIQRETLIGDMEEVGIVDALKAYRSARNGNALTILDGHLRKSVDPDQLWPVLVLDLTDEEADTQLAFHNHIAGMVQIDPVKLNALLQKAQIQNASLGKVAQQMRDRLAERVRVAEAAAAGKPRGSSLKVGDDKGSVIKVVVNVGDDLKVVEQALKRAGLPNRGDALVKICRHFLDNHDH